MSKIIVVMDGGLVSGVLTNNEKDEILVLDKDSEGAEPYEIISKKEKDFTVAMPYFIGCRRGGASWDEIYNLLNKYFGAEYQPNLTLYRI